MTGTPRQIASHTSPAGKQVKLADKICNLRDVVNAPPAGWPLERRREYFDWARQVVDGCRDAHAGLARQFDEIYLRATGSEL